MSSVAKSLKNTGPTLPGITTCEPSVPQTYNPSMSSAGDSLAKMCLGPGSGGGLDAARSGLWAEYARIVRELRPSFIIVENVAALLARGLDRVLGDLARIGYDAEWSVLSACSVGAPHVRRRLFIVAYPNGKHGRARIRDSATRAQRSIQALDGAPDSRASWRARMADPSSLYGGADGLPNGMDRNHAVGNAVVPQVGYVVGQVVRRIMETA